MRRPKPALSQGQQQQQGSGGDACREHALLDHWFSKMPGAVYGAAFRMMVIWALHCAEPSSHLSQV